MADQLSQLRDRLGTDVRDRQRSFATLFARKTCHPGRVNTPGRRPGRIANERLDASIAQYEIVATRRMNFDLLVWQVPILGLTAQAFLLTVGLGSSSTPWARVLTGLLGLLTTAVSIQLMAKHRHHEIWDSRWLETYEREAGLPPVHAWRPPESGIAKWRSYHLWVAALGVFGVVAVISLTSGLLEIATGGRLGAWFSG